MTPKEALSAISDQLSEFDSFAEGFDHVDHGDDGFDHMGGEFGQDPMDENDEPIQCRFDQANTAGAFEVLQKLIDRAEAAVNAAPDDLFDGVIYALSEALAGEDDEPIPAEPQLYAVTVHVLATSPHAAGENWLEGELQKVEEVRDPDVHGDEPS